MNKIALVVLGMHRSGTSALTHALSVVGAELPQDPIPKLENNNPEGFWESADVLGINETLLEEMGSRWDDWSRADFETLSPESEHRLLQRARDAVRDNYRDAPLIALKDPRISRIYPFWHQALEASGYSLAPVVIVRNPLEVAQSLAARDGFSLAKSVALWLRHVLDAEIQTRSTTRSILTYDQLIASPTDVLQKIAEDFDLPEVRIRQNYEANPILKADQRHHTIDSQELNHSEVTCGWAQDAYFAMSHMAEGKAGSSELSILDNVRSKFEDAMNLLGPLTQNAAEIERRATLTSTLSTSIEHGMHKLEAVNTRLEAIAEASKRARSQLAKSDGAIQQCTQKMAGHRRNIRRMRLLIEADHNRLAQTRATFSRMSSLVAVHPSRPLRFASLVRVMFRLRGMIEKGKRHETGLLLFQIARYDLFDHAWYMARYPVPSGGYAEQLAHWLATGWKEGFSPCPEFDVAYYLGTNEDVRTSGHNPLFHYLTHGAREKRRFGFYLDAAWYARTNPDIPNATARALTHYRCHGRGEGRQPNALFDPRHYQLQRPLVDLQDCLTDYILMGSSLDLQPSPHFKPGRYRKRNFLHQTADQEPLQHCLQTWETSDDAGCGDLQIPDDVEQLLKAKSGRSPTQQEQPSEVLPEAHDNGHGSRAVSTEQKSALDYAASGRDLLSDAIEGSAVLSACMMVFKSLIPGRVQPKLRKFVLRKNLRLQAADFNRVSTVFDENYYLSSYPELATMDCPAIEHYLRNGWREGRNPSANFNTNYYLEHNPDIARPDINPFVHWVLHGRAEKRPTIPHKMRLSNQHFLPLVTCIVPNFNHERFLRKRLDSILDQTYPNIELLILDDCSTDGSRTIIEDYARKHPNRIRTVYNETGSGSVFRQWQKGAALAQGDLTWICESDDYCESDFLAKLVPHFRDRSIQLAFGRIQFCDQDGAPYSGLDTYREQADPGKWSEVRAMPACKWFRGAFGVRNVIPNVGGCIWRSQKLPADSWDEASAYKVVGDWYLYSMLASGGQIAWNPGAVAYFRQHKKNTSVSSFRSDDYYLEHHRLMASLQQQWGLPQQTIKAFHHHLLQHSLAVDGNNAADKLQRFVRLEELRTVARQREHVLIAFLGFHPGGGEFFPIRLANSLHTRGMRVSLLALDMGRVNESMMKSLATGIPVYDAAYLSEYGVDRFLDDAGITLIHSHMISVEWYFFGKEKIRTRLPYVVTMHGSYESSPLKPSQLEPLVRNVTRWIYLADKNLVPLKNFAIPPQRLVKLPNAVPLDQRAFPRSRQEMDIEDDAIVFTLVARGIRRKGWRAAICAYLKLRQQSPARAVHLILAGEGNYVDELASRHGHEQGIHFVGFQSCIQGLYRMSDIALVPTRFEGESFPLCIIEAYLSGIPVVATDIGEIPSMVAPNGAPAGGLLVEQIRNTKAFVDAVSLAMAEMLQDDTRRKLTAGATKLAEKYNMDTLTTRYQDEYRAAMKAGPGARQVWHRNSKLA